MPLTNRLFARHLQKKHTLKKEKKKEIVNCQDTWKSKKKTLGVRTVSPGVEHQVSRRSLTMYELELVFAFFDSDSSCDVQETDP